MPDLWKKERKSQMELSKEVTLMTPFRNIFELSACKILQEDDNEERFGMMGVNVIIRNHQESDKDSLSVGGFCALPIKNHSENKFMEPGSNFIPENLTF